jgi:SAM-dependent methyltransferase
MKCQVCHGAMRPLFLKHSHQIFGCDGCGHRSAEVSSPAVYGDDYFQGGGAGYSDYLAGKDLLIKHGQRYARLLKAYMPAGTVLDVGAAAGFILQGMIGEGWRGRGIEPNLRMSEHARTHLHLGVETGSIEGFRTEERFDLVTMIQVVAHFPDVREAFEVSSEITRPGGFCLIETWNRESWTARIFGRHWHEYSPPSVLHWFTPATLRRLAEQFGFREVASGRPAKWLNAAHAMSLLTYKLGGGRLLRDAEKLIPRNIPLPYPGDDLFWMLFRRRGEAFGLGGQPPPSKGRPPPTEGRLPPFEG